MAYQCAQARSSDNELCYPTKSVETLPTLPKSNPSRRPMRTLVRNLWMGELCGVD